MNKKIFIFTLLLVFLISGCSKSPQNEVDISDNISTSESIQENVKQFTPIETEQINRYTLTLDEPEFRSDRIRFYWEMEPDDHYYMNKSGQEISWRLFRSPKSDAEYSKDVYWYRTVFKYNFNSVDDLPEGTHYFRVCLYQGKYDENDGKCILYSNIVEVVVP